jgi:hypothetical protein
MRLGLDLCEPMRLFKTSHPVNKIKLLGVLLLHGLPIGIGLYIINHILRGDLDGKKRALD